jgi:hypothetical protein
MYFCWSYMGFGSKGPIYIIKKSITIGKIIQKYKRKTYGRIVPLKQWIARLVSIKLWDIVKFARKKVYEWKSCAQDKKVFVMIIMNKLKVMH